MTKQTGSARRKVHPQVVAWRKWRDSNEGHKAASSGSFYGDALQYLENRLLRAFNAGWKRGKCDPTRQR